MIEVPNAQVWSLAGRQNETTASALSSREWLLSPGWMWFIQAAGAFVNIVGLLKAFELPSKNAVVE